MTNLLFYEKATKYCRLLQIIGGALRVKIRLCILAFKHFHTLALVQARVFANSGQFCCPANILCVLSYPKMKTLKTGPEFMKLFFMFNSTENEIYSAQKC